MADLSADQKQNTAAGQASGKPVGDVTVYDTDESVTAGRTTSVATDPTTSPTTRTDPYRTTEPAAASGGASAMTWVLVLIALAVLVYLLWQFVF